MIRPQQVGVVNEELVRLKQARGKPISSELKWEKSSRRDLPLYLDAVALFFSLLEANIINFHVVICDFHEYDHRRFTAGDKSASVSKTYYQLLLHRCCKLYGGDAIVYVWPDKGDCTKSLPQYVVALRSDERKKFGHETATIRSINPTSSAQVGVLHLNDTRLCGRLG